MPRQYIRIPAEDRFWRHVDRAGPIPEHRPDLGPCWVWTACTERKGYGKFWWNGHLTAAHRISYELTNGPIPDGLWALHHCDNRLCCNPAHLFLGTAADNTADMYAKGRAATGERHGMQMHPEAICTGERHGMARLTAVQVMDIRHQAADGVMQRALARRYGVAPATICLIVKRKTWRHI